jgi:alanine-glyoxylate transaminase/serine-glyoxylate transaminase/serine-pyruvate transaminase
MSYKSGRHFLQIPGPTNVPGRVLEAIARPTINHRGPEFASMTREILEGLQQIFKTRQPVVIFPASGHGAWEAAMVNALSPGDGVLMCETGHFGNLWGSLAERLGLKVDLIPGDWRHGADPEAIEAKLAEDTQHRIKAVAIVHCETSTGVVSRIPEIREAMNRAGHPALLMVDTISSLGSFDYRHDEWGVDVTAGASQKGLLLPPGLAFNAISEKAQAAAKTAGMISSYWDWSTHLGPNQSGFFPYTPATNLLYGLREAITLLMDEGLDAVFARHHRHGEATRCAVKAWGLENQCLNPDEYSDSVTAVRMPEGHDADELRKIILERFDMSLGNGLGKVKGRLFRIGHLGDFNDLMLAGTLCGVEMGLGLANVPCSKGGVAAALDSLAGAR